MGMGEQMARSEHLPQAAKWRPQRRGDIASQPARGEMLLYDPVADAVHVLNATALAVWDLCDGRHTAAEIAAALCVRFAGAAGYDVACDVRQTLERFQDEGLLA